MAPSAGCTLGGILARYLLRPPLSLERMSVDGMSQNIFDRKDFLASYLEMRASPASLNRLLEGPAFERLLPKELKGLRALDIGCGSGGLLEKLFARGLSSAVALDPSRRMMAMARERLAAFADRVTFENTEVESFAAPSADFDLVASSMTLHYVASITALFERCALWLRPGGVLVFSLRHPFLSSQDPTAPGEPDYLNEGLRAHDWLIEGSRIENHHRTVSSYVRAVLEAGLDLESLEEPQLASEQARAHPQLELFSRFPLCLVVRARKSG